MYKYYAKYIFLALAAKYKSLQEKQSKNQENCSSSNNKDESKTKSKIIEEGVLKLKHENKNKPQDGKTVSNSVNKKYSTKKRSLNICKYIYFYCKGMFLLVYTVKTEINCVLKTIKIHLIC